MRKVLNKSNGLLYIVFAAEPNQEPSPTFDIETNREDKDNDVDHPAVHKDPDTEKPEEENPAIPEKKDEYRKKTIE